MTEKRSILIVDDNVVLITSIALILKRKGHLVATANSGQEAIDMVRDRPFDLILMDVKMQGMSGIEAMEEIRTIRPDAAVVIMTAYDGEPLSIEARGKGAIGVLNKPFDMGEVLRIIEDAGTQ